jgi:group I intron endonuclease
MDKSQAKKEYLQTKRPRGVYRIRNTRNGKSYVGYSTDLPARMNRHKMELKFGSHRNNALRGEWELFGETSFEFEILDELEPGENKNSDLRDELRILSEMWIRKLEEAGGIVEDL